MRKTAFIILAAWALCSIPAAADGGAAGDWDIGFYGGFAKLDDYDFLQPENDTLYGVRLGHFLTDAWSLEGSYQRLSAKTDFPGRFRVPNEKFKITSERLNLLYSFSPGARFRPFLTLGVGREKTQTEGLAGLGDSSDVGFNAGAGLRWLLSDRFSLRFDGRFVPVGFDGGINEDQDNFEGTFGLSWLVGAGAAARVDTDGDGVYDRKDKCPGTPAGARVDASGCPIDTDGDGVYDGIDQCPDTPRGWPVDARGCPIDSDGDGVPDGGDDCPGTPRGAIVDARGCPKDSDGDGVYDGIDQCPDTPAGTPVDARGCPLPPPEPPPPPPPPPAPPIEPGKPLILEGVNFASDSAVLTPESRSILDRVAASLRDWPDVRVEVGGHTDSTNTDAYNLALSRRRADAVRQYLASQGVPAARLSVQGYGESQPIADNETEAGKARNRRVELKRLD